MSQDNKIKIPVTLGSKLDGVAGVSTPIGKRKSNLQ